jgi:hypothetical protein
MAENDEEEWLEFGEGDEGMAQLLGQLSHSPEPANRQQYDPSWDWQRTAQAAADHIAELDAFVSLRGPEVGDDVFWLTVEAGQGRIDQLLRLAELKRGFDRVEVAPTLEEALETAEVVRDRLTELARSWSTHQGDVSAVWKRRAGEALLEWLEGPR